jgi:hypothetical protein
LNRREFIAASRRVTKWPFVARTPRLHKTVMLREAAMLGFSRWQIFKTSAATVLAVGTISLLLIYFIPAPPSTVTMATANKGTTFEYFGQRYRDIFCAFSR